MRDEGIIITGKPPLGVVPESIWKRARKIDLARTIWEYLVSGREPNAEWIDELARLNREVE